MNKTTKIFGTEDIRRVIDAIGLDQVMDSLIDGLQEAFAAYDESSIEVPVRNGFHYEQPKSGLIEWMPVMSRGQHALMKLVSYHPDNPETEGLPTILSTFSLMDTRNGHTIAISDGTLLTALRTGAASAIATRALASGAGGALGLIGCGAQAVTQLHAISRVWSAEMVLYWDVDRAARESFAERVAPWLPDSVRLLETPLDMIVPNVDVLCTATSIAVGEGPLFQRCRTRKGLHLNAVGSDFPGKVEIPRELLHESVVIPDFAAQAIAEGECQQLDLDHVGPELYALLQSGEQPELREMTTVFDSTGWALEDLVAMELLTDWGRELDLGVDFQLESIPADPKNPYVLADNGKLEKSASRH